MYLNFELTNFTCELCPAQIQFNTSGYLVGTNGQMPGSLSKRLKEKMAVQSRFPRDSGASIDQ